MNKALQVIFNSPLAPSVMARMEKNSTVAPPASSIGTSPPSRSSASVKQLQLGVAGRVVTVDVPEDRLQQNRPRRCETA